MSNQTRHIVKYYNRQARRVMYKTVFFINDYFGWGDDDGQFFTEDSAKERIKNEFKQLHNPRVFDKSLGVRSE